MNKFEVVMDIVKDLIDDNTLIILGALVIAGISPEHRELIIGGLLGWIAQPQN